MNRKLVNGDYLDNKPLSNSVFHDCIQGLIAAIDERTALERDKFVYQMKRNEEGDGSKRRLMKTLQVIYDQSKASKTSPGEALQKLYEQFGLNPNDNDYRVAGKNLKRKKFNAASLKTKGKKIRTR